jgi:hypothetical protein
VLVVAGAVLFIEDLREKKENSTVGLVSKVESRI